ncbi:MAG: flavin reductase family protein [Planctomycetota bacterium]
MRIDPAGLEARDLYRLMISVVVPRPIAWVSTKSAAGVLNAAPFSYFQALSSQPPMVMIAVGRKRGGEAKDTRTNIEETGEFVINIVNEASGPAMVRTSVAYESGISEFDEVGLTPVPSEIVAPPRIGESPVALECRLDRVIEIGTSGVCIGEVVLFHLADEIVDPETGVADPSRLAPLGRLGGSLYAPLRDVVSIDTDGNISPSSPP